MASFIDAIPEGKQDAAKDVTTEECIEMEQLEFNSLF
jgi:hypothetical protein